MITNHTPGPWEVTSNGIKAPNGHIAFFDVSAGPNESNARLIGAAPRLLAALWSLLGTLPPGSRGGEFLEAMNAVQQAHGLPEYISFDAAIDAAMAAGHH